VVALLATLFRLAYVLVAKDADPLVGDQIFYSGQAETLADGKGFLHPHFEGVEAADHPPVTSLVLAPVSAFFTGADLVLAQRLFMAVLGGLAVFLIGLLGRSITTDPRIGLVAAALAASSANFWMNDGLIMSETPTVVALTITLLLVYRYARRRDRVSAAGLGAALGIMVLTRAELALLVPLVVIPLVLFVPPADAVSPSRSPWPRKLGHLALAGAVAITTQLPWWVPNARRFEHTVLFSTNEGLTYIGANCDAVYDPVGGIGFWSLECAYAVPTAPGLDQSEISRVWRDAAFSYIREHRSEVPRVVAARVGRAWGVFRPFDMVSINEGEGRERWASYLGIWTWWVTAPLALAGGVLLRRRRVMLFPLVVLPVIVTVVAGWFYGIIRFRTPAEVAAVVFAAVTIVAVWDRWRTRRRPVSPSAAGPEPEPPAPEAQRPVQERPPAADGVEEPATPR
jgi:hypothetical protein